MDPLLAAAMIGELLSWLGFGLAVPFLLIGGLIRLIDGGWAPTEVFIDDRTARWTVGDRTFSRELDDHELADLPDLDDEPVQHGFTSRNRPSSLRFEAHSPIARVLLVVGAVLLGVGVIGTVLSLLPLLG